VQTTLWEVNSIPKCFFSGRNPDDQYRTPVKVQEMSILPNAHKVKGRSNENPVTMPVSTLEMKQENEIDTKILILHLVSVVLELNMDMMERCCLPTQIHTVLNMNMNRILATSSLSTEKIQLFY
jgi:hypothetical protein